MKLHTTVTLDKELVEEMKTRRNPLSPVLNSLLREFLGPKKADKKSEAELSKLLGIAKSLGLSFEEVEFLKQMIDRQTVEVWKIFKQKFDPDFSMFKFAEISRKFKAELGVEGYEKSKKEVLK